MTKKIKYRNFPDFFSLGIDCNRINDYTLDTTSIQNTVTFAVKNSDRMELEEKISKKVNNTIYSIENITREFSLNQNFPNPDKPNYKQENIRGTNSKVFFICDYSGWELIYE